MSRWLLEESTFSNRLDITIFEFITVKFLEWLFVPS